MAGIDDQHPARLVADVLHVVGDTRVPREVVTGPELGGVVSLRHPPPTTQDHVVLVAGVGVDAGAATGRDDGLDDAEVPRGSRIDLGELRHLVRDPRALGRTDDAWRGGRVEEQPRNRDVEGASDADERVERRNRLLVLDLRQVADVETAPLRDAGERQLPRPSPATDLAADSRSAGRRRTVVTDRLMAGRGRIFVN